MAEPAARAARVAHLLAAAKLLVDSGSEAGQRLRRRLLETSGLSEAGIELGLRRCLETHASESELSALLATTPEASRAHVLLSGNVFVAALRAIAIGAASSEHVFVRASRRDPALAEALHELTPASFSLVTGLAPAPGDRVFCYGSDETLRQLRATLPPGVWFHGHGHGFGVAVVEANAVGDLREAARDIALDAALFDQRGCLSPRMVCAIGSEARARALAEALAEALATLEQRVPLGSQTQEQRAEARRLRDAATYAYEVLDARSSWVSLAPVLALPPSGRNLHVSPTADAIAALRPFTPHLTCIGARVSRPLRNELSAHFPGARLVELGRMQRPPLDGPVDLRRSPGGELLPGAG